MIVAKHLTDGGVPRDWSVHNLQWLAQSHRNLARHQNAVGGQARTDWHRRWAALIEDLLETTLVNRH